MNNKTTVFLGGTCNGSNWRDVLIPLLSENVLAFNPILPPGVKWTSEHKEVEIKARQESDYVVYVITPKMTGFYSISELVDDSNKRPEKTIFCFLSKDEDNEFSEHQRKSLIATGEMVKSNGATWFKTLEEIADFFSNK